MSRADRPSASLVITDAPARLERLPWGAFHTLVVVALGVTWILDGLEVTLAGSVAGALKTSPALRFTDSDVGAAGAFYLIGAVTGAIGFGWLTDRVGRRPLFFVTLTVYLLATAATGLSWDKSSFFLFRLLTGAGIGGEYAAINSTIQELVPARYRGWTDLVVNGSFWIGAAIGAGGSLFFLDSGLLGPDLGWRAAFLVGAAIGLVILGLRSFLPESPRWLALHGRAREADAVVSQIEARFVARGVKLPAPGSAMKFRARATTPLSDVARALFVTFRSRTLVGLALMAAQAFFYNAIFFTYALILTRFYGVPAGSVGLYVLPFALGNVLGPVLLGRLFDTIGRRKMIFATYATSGALLFVVGLLFRANAFTALTQTAAWSVVFFFASPAASAAYLTVSESFPLEIRALAIAFFYAIGTALGGVAAPFIFGKLIETGSRGEVMEGYAFGAALMILAALIAARFGVDAERKPLESVAAPLSAVE